VYSLNYREVAYAECGDVGSGSEGCAGDQRDGYQNGYKVVIFLFHFISPFLVHIFLCPANPNDLSDVGNLFDDNLPAGLTVITYASVHEAVRDRAPGRFGRYVGGRGGTFIDRREGRGSSQYDSYQHDDKVVIFLFHCIPLFLAISVD
jgi:hypothetical protein